MASRTTLITTNDMQTEQDISIGSLNRTYNFHNYDGTFRTDDEEDEEPQLPSYVADMFSDTWQPQAFSSPQRLSHATMPITDASLQNQSSNVTMPVVATSPTHIPHYSKEEIENMLFQKIKNYVRELINLSDHQYPLNRVIQWSIGQEPKLQYTLNLIIQQPTKDGIPVRPIENMIHAITTNISKFLTTIIQAIFNEKCKETTIIDGAHLIRRMQKYVNNDRLKSTTLFCTFDIRNLYTMLPQDEALNILMDFLHHFGYTKVKGINLDTIRKLSSIVLKENAFVYNNKIYRQTTGGAMGSSFTLVLANIFMWKWEKQFVRLSEISGEFYGRYIDDILLTWNESEKELIELLTKANTWHPNIQFDFKISKQLPFLDVLLTNNNGTLKTSVYHKPTTQPYVVPFHSDHPRHIFNNIMKTTIQRAIRYSSTFELFNYERQSIKLKLLYNGYPSSFIEHQFHQFFSEYIDPSSFLSYIINEQKFLDIQQKITEQPTPRQSQVALSAATADIDNDPTDDNINAPINTTENEATTIPTNPQRKLIVHYSYEKRFISFARKMHQDYENVFKNTNAMALKLIVGNRNRRNIKKELIHNRPKRSILKATQIKSKYVNYIEKRRNAKTNKNRRTTTAQQ